jgi:GT2 family glycosyltransferase
VGARPLVGVVVLSWNGRDDTRACLRSLRAVSYQPARVVVVDNGSVDGTAEVVRAEFPEVELVRHDRNMGFAGGANAGMSRALELGAEHVLLLNNDTQVEPGFVDALVDEARHRPDAAALCSKILFLEPPDRIWWAGSDYDPRRGHQRRPRGHGDEDGAPFSVVQETDRACGAAMLVPRAVLDRVGAFDEDLFAYYEDADWSLRARAAGLRIFVVPASRVWHRVSAASGGASSPRTLYFGARNAMVAAERHAPLGPIGTWRRRAVILAAHLAQALRGRTGRSGLAAAWNGWWDGVHRRLGPMPSD